MIPFYFFYELIKLEQKKIIQYIMKKRNQSIFLFCFLLFSLSSWSQSYDHSVGIKLGIPNGISYKHFFAEQSAIEGILSLKSETNYDIIGLSAYYQVHLPLVDTNAGLLYWYFGGGLGVGFLNYEEGIENQGNTVLFGGGNLGAEFVFDDIPLNIALDWNPSINLVKGPFKTFTFNQFGLAIRYIIPRRRF